MIKKLLTLFFTGLATISYSQEYEVTGTIKDRETKEPLVGATIFIDSLNIGTLTNEKGYYKLTLPTGKYKILYSFIGYENKTENVYLAKDDKININLNSLIKNLDEVVVQSEPLKQKLLSTQMSLNTISSQEAKLLPAIFGEVDIIKTLQLKPGVKSGGEGSSGLYVRGGGADQNLFLLNNAVIYNPSHLFGFFSIFNSDVVDKVQLYQGGFPARFGGRLSSIVDVKMRESDCETLGVTGGIGLIASRLAVERKFNENGSIILSGRRTYVDVFTRMFNKANEDNEDYDPFPNYFFTDFNGQLSYKLGEKDKVSITGYHGKDKIRFLDESFDITFQWGNQLLQTQWNHKFNNQLSSNVSLYYSKYNYELKNNFTDFSFKVGSKIEDITALIDFDHYLGNRHTFKYGASAIFHQFEIGRLKAASSDQEVSFNSGNSLEAGEFGAYVSDDFKVNNALTINGGVRLSGFVNNGKGYMGVEPRLSGKYTFNNNLTLKMSYTKMYQYVHLVSNSSASLPTDIWYPSNKVVKPENAQQVAGGVSILLANKKLLLTNEVYYKWMGKQIDFRDGAQLFVNQNLDEEFVFGKGESYGNEFYLEKREGKTTGWIGYTLSWTWRQFDEINNGEKFYARYDRRHDISVVLMHKLNKRLSISGTWVYGTGNAVTMPEGRFVMQDIDNVGPKVVPVYTERNAYIIKPYHRMDLGIVYKFFSKWGQSDITLSAYNLYNRRNVYFIYIDEFKNDEGITSGFQAKQVSLFPIIPSITYNFKFGCK